MQQARAAPGSASRRTHHAQKRGSLSKGRVSRAARQAPLTSRKRPVNPEGNHIRENMFNAFARGRTAHHPRRPLAREDGAPTLCLKTTTIINIPLRLEQPLIWEMEYSQHET